jgi:hypothetical protein
VRKHRRIFHWKRKTVQRAVNNKEWQDLIDFEGNANVFGSYSK